MNENYMPVGEVAPFDAYNCPTPGYSNELMATGRLKVSLVLTLEVEMVRSQTFIPIKNKLSPI